MPMHNRRLVLTKAFPVRPRDAASVREVVTVMSHTLEPNSSRHFSKLSNDGRSDRLSFRIVLNILTRTLPLLHVVRGHLAILAVTGLVMIVIAVPVTLLTTDILTTRVLQGRHLTPFEARLLLLDPEEYALPEPDRIDSRTPALTPANRRSVRNRWVVAAAAMIFVATPIVAGAIWYWIWILQRINQALRVGLYERMQMLSPRFHTVSRVGDSVYRLFQDSAMVTSIIEILFIRPLQFGLLYLVGLTAAFLLDPVLGLIVLLVWLPALVLGKWLSGRLRHYFRHARERNSVLVSRIQETLNCLQVIKSCEAEYDQQRLFETASLDAFRAAFRARYSYMLFGVLMFWIAGSMLIFGLVRSSVLASLGADLFAPRMLGFFGFTAWSYGLMVFARNRLAQGISSVDQFMGWWGRAQDVAIGLDRVYEILDLSPNACDPPDAIGLHGIADGIEFRSVSFAYDQRRPILKNIDFAVRTGTLTGIIGPTGAGKSTLMWLLLRLFDPQQGHIEIDGCDIRRIKLDSLRQAMAVALQEHILFEMTVRENIRYAAPNASDHEVRTAARIATADHFIETLPDGYDTVLGERGIRLSTGERQRISIARAILKDTPILILDEPTASLDPQIESILLQNLSEWKKGRVIYLITHRLSTLQYADQILYLDGSQAFEFGTHAELMARPNSTYRHLVEREAFRQALRGTNPES